MEKLKVLIRIRPFLPYENELNTTIILDPLNNNKIELTKSLKKFQGFFDLILSQDSTQKDVFNFVRPCIKKIQEGFNCAVLAYGQTGSGKTYTMFGGDWAMNENTLDYQKRKNFIKDDYNFILNKELIIDPFSENNGIIPNLILGLFNKFNNAHGNGIDNEITLSCSYIQIYNERIYDLLIDEKELNKQIAKKQKFNLINLTNTNATEVPIKQAPLKIKYDKKLGVIIEGVNEIKTPSFYEMFELLRLGETNRKIRQTNKNHMSSRSHTVFIINMENSKTGVKSKIKLCDLAGSERYDSSEKYKKMHIDEMCNINKSLSTLGNVIHCLGGNKKNPNPQTTHIPYKESKLTQILEDSLGGNSSTYLIATISPSDDNFEETLNTLKFADRAHEVMTQITPNQIGNAEGQQKEIKKLYEEVSQLKELLSIREKRGTLLPIQEELIKLKKENFQLKKYLGGKNNVANIQKLITENNDLKKEIKFLTSQGIKNEGISSNPTSAFSGDSNKSNAGRGPLINTISKINSNMGMGANLDSLNNNINNRTNANSLKIRHNKILVNKIFDNSNNNSIKVNSSVNGVKPRNILASVGEEIVKNNKRKKTGKLKLKKKNSILNINTIKINTNENNDQNLKYLTANNINNMINITEPTLNPNLNLFAEQTIKESNNNINNSINNSINNINNATTNQLIVNNSTSDYFNTEDNYYTNTAGNIVDKGNKAKNTISRNSKILMMSKTDKINSTSVNMGDSPKEKSPFVKTKYNQMLTNMNSIEKKNLNKKKALIDEIMTGRNNPDNVRSNSKNKFNKYIGFRYININNI